METEETKGRGRDSRVIYRQMRGHQQTVTRGRHRRLIHETRPGKEDKNEASLWGGGGGGAKESQRKQV